MNYMKITEEFIEEYADYKHDISNFNDYLKTQWKNSLSDETLLFLIQGLNVDFLLSSLIYNVEEKKKYKSKTSAKRYATVLGQFFNFIRKTTNIENPKLYDEISYNRSRESTYMKRMLSYIENSDQLAGIVELEALEHSEVEKIIEWADRQLENENEWYSEQERLKVSSLELKKAMAALGMKMMLVYGITYRELRKIKLDQYNEIRNSIIVNGYELRLPFGLAIQMKRMMTFLQTNNIKNKEGLFFIVDNMGQTWGDITSSSGIPDYLRLLIGNTSVTSIVKYGISQLLKTGLNESIIKEITGASDRLIQGCIGKKENWMEIINNKLVTVDLYYRF